MYTDKNNLGLGLSPRINVMVKIVRDLRLTNAKILDFGCYDGTLLSIIKNDTNEFYGIEASDYGVRECKKNGLKVKNFFYTDDSTVPFGNNFFNVVIAGEIIEHIYDTDRILKEINRILKLGGYFLISTPNVASLGRRMMLLLGVNPLIEVSPNEPESSGHIRYFTFEGLTNLLKKHGFSILSSRSDVVNFSNDGKHRNRFLSTIFPTLGQSVICLAKKN